MVNQLKSIVFLVLVSFVIAFSAAAITACCPAGHEGCDWFSSNENSQQQNMDEAQQKKADV